MKYIVAEISKNWIDGREAVPNGLLQKHFEKVIEENLRRGYELHSFQVHRLITCPRSMNETIIAVFEKRGGEESELVEIERGSEHKDL